MVQPNSGSLLIAQRWVKIRILTEMGTCVFYGWIVGRSERSSDDNPWIRVSDGETQQTFYLKQVGVAYGRG